LHMNTTIIPYASFMDRLYFIYKYKNRATWNQGSIFLPATKKE
jgi:hypothetical protein